MEKIKDLNENLVLKNAINMIKDNPKYSDKCELLIETFLEKAVDIASKRRKNCRC